MNQQISNGEENRVNILRGGASHLDDIARLFDAYRQWYRAPTDLAGSRTFIEERIRNQESVIYVVNINGEAAGFTQLYPAFSSISMKRLWILNDLFVDSKYRQQGVATALLNATYQLAEETGAVRLELATEIDNHHAQQLYEKEGWIRDEVFLYYDRNTKAE